MFKNIQARERISDLNEIPLHILVPHFQMFSHEFNEIAEFLKQNFDSKDFTTLY